VGKRKGNKFWSSGHQVNRVQEIRATGKQEAGPDIMISWYSQHGKLVACYPYCFVPMLPLNLCAYLTNLKKQSQF
jgi:hypothetical protein